MFSMVVGAGASEAWRPFSGSARIVMPRNAVATNGRDGGRSGDGVAITSLGTLRLPEGFARSSELTLGAWDFFSISYPFRTHEIPMSDEAERVVKSKWALPLRRRGSEKRERGTIKPGNSDRRGWITPRQKVNGKRQNGSGPAITPRQKVIYRRYYVSG